MFAIISLGKRENYILILLLLLLAVIQESSGDDFAWFSGPSQENEESLHVEVFFINIEILSILMLLSAQILFTVCFSLVKARILKPAKTKKTGF